VARLPRHKGEIVDEERLQKSPETPAAPASAREVAWYEADEYERPHCGDPRSGRGGGAVSAPGGLRQEPRTCRVEAATKLLNSPVANERRLGADLLGQAAAVDHDVAAPAADTLLSHFEQERDNDALQTIIVALGHLGDERARAGIVRHTGHPDEQIRYAVAWALPSVGLDERYSGASELSRDSDEDVRDWATFGLVESDADDVPTREALTAPVDDPHDDTRAEGIYGLARRRDPGRERQIEREHARPTHGSLIDRALEELED
jgi:hypothetical protein